jgi:hypothetical protein
VVSVHWAEIRDYITAYEGGRGVCTSPNVVRTGPIASVACLESGSVVGKGHLKSHVDNELKERVEESVRAFEVVIFAGLPHAVVLIEVA